jgi:hypothetical protein
MPEAHIALVRRLLTKQGWFVGPLQCHCEVAAPEILPNVLLDRLIAVVEMMRRCSSPTLQQKQNYKLTMQII